MSAKSLSRSGRIQSSSSSNSCRNIVICDGQRRRAVIPRAAVYDSSGQSRYTGPSLVHDRSLWLPPSGQTNMDIQNSGTGAPGEAAAASYDGHKPQTPPPDLPSLLLDSRIVYLGMPVRAPLVLLFVLH